MTAGKHVSFIAVACVLVAISPINGPLLQRASRSSFGHFSSMVDLSLQISRQLPIGYTGTLSGRADTALLLMPAFTKVVQASELGSAINVSSSGCEDFSKPTTEPDGSFDTSQTVMANGTHFFETMFQWSFVEPGTIGMNILYQDAPACNGTLQIRNYTLNATVVNYPVVLPLASSQAPQSSMMP